MADLNTINLEITGTSASAEAAVQSTMRAVEGLKNVANSLSGIRFSQDIISGISAAASAMQGLASATTAFQNGGDAGGAFSGFATAVNNLATACKSLTQEDVAKLQAVANVMNSSSSGSWANAQSGVQNAQAAANNAPASGTQGTTAAVSSMSSASGSLKSAYSSIKNTISNVSAAVSKLSKTFSLAQTPVGKFVSSLMRVAKMRLLRTIISSITSGASTGLKNLANASAEANATLSQLSSASLTLKNSVGGALYSALAGVVGMLQTIINAAVSAMNWINMLFSALGGSATFKKATSATQQYASSLGGAAGGAKALKQELMGFDEINSLTPDSSGGGGGGGAGSLDYGSMFEESAIDADLLKAIETADFTLIGKKLASKINTALASVDWDKYIKKGARLGQSLATFINGAVEELDADTIGRAIAGVVNTGLTTVNTFVRTTNWSGLGSKIKLILKKAINSINAKDVGEFIAAKFKIALGFLAGLIPSSAEEWDEVTTWVADALNAAIADISTEDIKTVIVGVIQGGLSLITSLGEAHVLSNIGAAVLTAIEDALDEISADDIQKAAQAIIDELQLLVGQALELALELMKVVIEVDNPLVTGLTAWGITSILQKSLGFLGIKSGKTGLSGLTMFGSVYFALDAVVKLGQIVESVNNGEGVSWKDIADTIGSALISAGLAAVASGHLQGGLIVIGVGVILKAATKTTFTDEGALPTDVFSGDYADAIGNIKVPFQEFTANVGGIYQPLDDLKAALKDLYGENYDTSSLDTAMQGLAGVFNQYTGMDASIEEVQALIDTMFSGKYDTTGLGGTADGLLALFAAFKQFNTGRAELGSFEEFLSTEGINGFSQATENAKEAAGAMGASMENLTDQLETEASGGGVNELSTSIEEVSASMQAAGDQTEDLAASMQATGEQAEELAIKIIEIPSDIVYNLELNNYDAVMEQLDELHEAICYAGRFGSFDFKNSFYNIGSWVADNVVSPISDAFSGLNLFTVGRKIMTSLKNGMKSISMPKFKVEWSSSSSKGSIFGKTFTISIPTPSISFKAKGGFLTAGELFVANEAGPELVGKIGNKSAVANETQIGDAIFKYMDAHGGGNGGTDANALASALVNAMKAAGLGAVYLDGKMLGNSINREAKRSGKPVINY